MAAAATIEKYWTIETNDKHELVSSGCPEFNLNRGATDHTLFCDVSKPNKYKITHLTVTHAGGWQPHTKLHIASSMTQEKNDGIELAGDMKGSTIRFTSDSAARIDLCFKINGKPASNTLCEFGFAFRSGQKIAIRVYYTEYT